MSSPPPFQFLSAIPVTFLPPPLTTAPSPTGRGATEQPTTIIVPNSANVSGQAGSGNILASAALYLYTFLATLILLVAISLFILIRSLLQRRRHNRAVQEAFLRYANGGDGNLELGGLVGALNHQVLGQKPGICDVYLAPTTSDEIYDLDKTPEGKVISSSWRLHHRSNLSSWSWSSIFPLSSTPDQWSASSEDVNKDISVTGSTAVDVRSSRRRNVALSDFGWLFGRILHASRSSRNQTDDAYELRRQTTSASAPSSPATSSAMVSDTAIADPIAGTSTPSSSRPDNRHRTRQADSLLEEGSFHMRGLSGSSPASSSNSYSDPNPEATNANVIRPTSNTDTSATEGPTSGTILPSNPQSDVIEAHISPQISSPSRNQAQTPYRNRHQKSSSATIDKFTRMRVAVLVRMPTPPPFTPTPSIHSGSSKAKLKAKADSGSGHELNDFGGKRLSSSSSTLGDDVASVRGLEVGLADVDVFPGFGGREEEGELGAVRER